METETGYLIPLMLIDDQSRYITHENSDEERKAAVGELGECLKSAMADCYANNMLTKEAYISNIQKYLGGAAHQITFEPNMEVKLVDQYGRPWSEVEVDKSMTSPLTGDRTLSETHPSFDPLDIGSMVFYEERQPIPLEYIKDYYKQKMNGIENPSIDILALGKGPLSYEGAKSYIESDPMYLNILTKGANSLSLLEEELLLPLPKRGNALITDESMKSKLKGSNMIGAANYEKITDTTIDEYFDISLGSGLVRVSHTQKVTRMVIHGEEGKGIGAYIYTDLNIDSIEDEVGVGLTFLDTWGIELYVKNTGIGAKFSANTDDFGASMNLDISLFDDVTASVGFVRKFDDGDVEDSYEIRGNFWAVLCVLYALFTGMGVPSEQTNGGMIGVPNK